MKLQQNERLRNFGIFSPTAKYHHDDDRKEVDAFVESIVKEMDRRFLDPAPDKYYGDLLYTFSAVLSVLKDPLNSIAKHRDMPPKVHRIWRFVHKILCDDAYSHIIDHIFWYYLEPDPKDGGNTTSFNKNRFLVFESHPYSELNNNDFKKFATIANKHGDYLQIQIRPGSHYFMDRTLYLRFIVDTQKLPSKSVIESSLNYS